MSAIFIAGTGTDVGKTWLTAGLLQYLRAEGHAPRALKPVVSGYDPARPKDSDPGVLLDAMGREASADNVANIAPFRYAAPLAPNMAARREGQRLEFGDIVAFCRGRIGAARDPLLIEGVGGVMSPIAEGATCLDLMEALRLPVVLIGGTYLGAISHTLTGAAALAARGVALAAIVVNESAVGGVGLTSTRDEIAAFQRALPVFAMHREEAGDEVLSALARTCGLTP